MEDPRVKLAIDKNWEFLKRHLVVTVTMVDRLYEAGIITDYTRQSLISQSDLSQISTLLGILRTKSMVAFRKFTSILRICKDGWIADSLLNTPMQEAWGSGINRTHGKDKTMRNYVDLPASMDITGLADAYISKRDVVPNTYHRRETDLFHDKYLTTSLTRPSSSYVSDMQLSTYRPYMPPTLPNRLNSPYMTSQIISADYHVPVRETVTYHDRYAIDDLATKVSHVHVQDIRRAEDLARVPRHVEEVHRTFQAQRLGANKALSDLKREEMEMKTALQSNVRDQANIYHNQRLLTDLDHRLHQIEADASNLKLRPVANTRVVYKVDPAISTPWAYKTYRY